MAAEASPEIAQIELRVAALLDLDRNLPAGPVAGDVDLECLARPNAADRPGEVGAGFDRLAVGPRDDVADVDPAPGRRAVGFHGRDENSLVARRSEVFAQLGCHLEEVHSQEPPPPG